MPKAIPYGKQSITEADIQSVVDVLRSDFLTQGPMVPRFETAVANYCQAQFAVAVNSATSALHIACLALDLGPGDWLWTSPITFVASANCGRYCGAQVDFVDIDSKTYNMCPSKLEIKLQAAKKEGKLPKVVVPVHFAGQSCDMVAIQNLSMQYGFKIIEDASHAIGAQYLNQTVGNCRYSDITVFSFHPVKIITTAEGGMAVTNDAQLSNRMRKLRSHGITSDIFEMATCPVDEIWNYKQKDLGYNYRMTEMQAALGISQMNRLDSFIEKRRLLASIYDEKLKELGLIIPFQSNDGASAYHLYPILINMQKTNVHQKELYKWMHEKNIQVNLHYIPVYLQPYYQKTGFIKGYCPIAEKYFKNCISIPLFSSMTTNEQNSVCEALKDGIQMLSKNKNLNLTKNGEKYAGVK